MNTRRAWFENCWRNSYPFTNVAGTASGLLLGAILGVIAGIRATINNNNKEESEILISFIVAGLIGGIAIDLWRWRRRVNHVRLQAAQLVEIGTIVDAPIAPETFSRNQELITILEKIGEDKEQDFAFLTEDELENYKIYLNNLFPSTEKSLLEEKLKKYAAFSQDKCSISWIEFANIKGFITLSGVAEYGNVSKPWTSTYKITGLIEAIETSTGLARDSLTKQPLVDNPSLKINLGFSFEIIDFINDAKRILALQQSPPHQNRFFDKPIQYILVTSPVATVNEQNQRLQNR